MKMSEQEILAIQQRSSEIRARIRASIKLAQAIVTASLEPILAIDRDFQVVTANHAYDRMFELKFTPVNEVSHRSRQAVIDKLWTIPELRPSLEDIFEHDNYFKNYPVEQTFDRIGLRSILLSARQMYNTTDEPLILLTIVDTTCPPLQIHHRNEREDRVSCHNHEITAPAIGFNTISNLI